MVTRRRGLKIWNNTFQFLSAIGVGLYRVTDSTIMHNRIDWCVRGYSHGFYNRGQDSAGLLMYEQCSNNVVAYNSITHGGDGLFLWAGQSTMDTGKGGSNDNVFYGNDFSHAADERHRGDLQPQPVHRNRVEEMLARRVGRLQLRLESGRTTGSRATPKRSRSNTARTTRFSGNTFDRDETAIRLWQNASPGSRLGIPEESRHEQPWLRDSGQHVPRQQDRRRRLKTRRMSGAMTSRTSGRQLSVEGATPGVSIEVPGSEPAGVSMPALRSCPAAWTPMIKHGERRGRDTIIVDEWGPYDWKSPKLWPVLDQPA